MDKVTLTAADGTELAARGYAPATAPQGNVVIGAQRHFDPFRSGHKRNRWPRMARWLHQLGTPVTA